MFSFLLFPIGSFMTHFHSSNDNTVFVISDPPSIKVCTNAYWDCISWKLVPTMQIDLIMFISLIPRRRVYLWHFPRIAADCCVKSTRKIAGIAWDCWTGWRLIISRPQLRYAHKIHGYLIHTYQFLRNRKKITPYIGAKGRFIIYGQGTEIFIFEAAKHKCPKKFFSLIFARNT